jgi:chemotaxis protein MotB
MSLPDDEPGPGVPEWVVTYGDMMSLLLTFFIMLVSMSELKEDGKLRAMLDSYRQAFGPSAGLGGAPGRSLQTHSALDQRSSRGTSSNDGIERWSRDADGPSGANRPARRINHGTSVTLGGPAVFERFSAELTGDLKAHLDIIAEVVAGRSNRIVIRGHASPEPLPAHASFRVRVGDEEFIVKDPMDLSFARAQQVAEYLAARGIDRQRMQVSAAGDAEPKVLTRKKDDQNANRRVDVFLIDSYIVETK